MNEWQEANARITDNEYITRQVNHGYLEDALHALYVRTDLCGKRVYRTKDGQWTRDPNEALMSF